MVKQGKKIPSLCIYQQHQHMKQNLKHLIEVTLPLGSHPAQSSKLTTTASPTRLSKEGAPRKSKEKLPFNYVSITALKRETHSK